MTEKKKVDDGLAAKVNGNSKRLNVIEELLEGLFGPAEHKQAGSLKEAQDKAGRASTWAMIGLFAIGLIGFGYAASHDVVNYVDDDTSQTEIMLLEGHTDGTGKLTITGEIEATEGITGGTGGSGSGTSVLSTVTATFSETGNKTITYTLASAPIVLIQGGSATTNISGSVHLGVLPQGLWNFDGTVVNDITLVATNKDFSSTNEWTFSVGTAAATGATLAGTEIDFAPTNSIVQSTNVFDTVASAEFVYDGTASGLSVYLNCLVTAAAGSPFQVGVTNTLNGTVTVTGKNCGDN